MQGHLWPFQSWDVCCDPHLWGDSEMRASHWDWLIMVLLLLMTLFGICARR